MLLSMKIMSLFSDRLNVKRCVQPQTRWSLMCQIEYSKIYSGRIIAIDVEAPVNPNKQPKYVSVVFVRYVLKIEIFFAELSSHRCTLVCVCAAKIAKNVVVVR